MRAADWKMMGRPLIGKMDKRTDIFKLNIIQQKKKREREKDKLQNTQKHG